MAFGIGNSQLPWMNAFSLHKSRSVGTRAWVEEGAQRALLLTDELFVTDRFRKRKWVPTIEYPPVTPPGSYRSNPKLTQLVLDKQNKSQNKT